METIKPCPFCGGIDTEIRSTGSPTTYWLSCKNQECSADGPFVDAGVFAATKAWNTRTPTIDPKDVARLIAEATRAGRVAKTLGGAIIALQELSNALEELPGVIGAIEALKEMEGE